MKRPRKVFVSTQIEACQLERLHALSEHTRVPWSVYVREGVQMLLAQKEAGGTGGGA